MTPFSKIYNSFLSKITDDMYMELTKEDTYLLLEDLLMSAIPCFEFPRKPLDYVLEEVEVEGEDGYFANDLTDEEINILAIYMVTQWLGQQLATIENVRMKYTGSDFKMTSQANHMAKVKNLMEKYEKDGFHMQRLYKRRKKDANGIYRSTMHLLRETNTAYPFSKGNEDPDSSSQEEGYWYDNQ